MTRRDDSIMSSEWAPMTLAMGLLTLIVAGCDAINEDRDRGIDNEVQSTAYYQDRDVGVCYGRTSDGNTLSLVYVPCTPEVMGKIAEREARHGR